MAGFTGVHKKRRRTGRSQGGSNFGGDMAGLAHARANYAALALQQQTTSGGEISANSGLNCLQSLNFNRHHAMTAFNQ